MKCSCRSFFISAIIMFLYLFGGLFNLIWFFSFFFCFSEQFGAHFFTNFFPCINNNQTQRIFFERRGVSKGKQIVKMKNS